MARKHALALTVHRGAYIQTADPSVALADEMQAGVLWLDTTSTPYVLKSRNDDNDGWDSLGVITSGPAARTLTASGAAVESDDVLFLNGAAVTLALLAAANRTRPLVVKNIHATAAATIDGDGSETIDGATTLTLLPGDRVTILPRTSSAWETL